MDLCQEILRLYEEKHLSERAIAKELDTSPSTVHYWIVRGGKRAKTKSGRPRKATDDKTLYEASCRNPFLTAVDLCRDFAPTCSVDTVRNRLKQQGLKCYTPARKPFITEFHRQKRFAYALNYLHWSCEEWKRVVFSDEKVFRSSSRGALRVYRPKDSNRYDDAYVVNPNTGTSARFTICVWMAFGGDGRIKQLHRIEQKTLNSDYYTTRVLPSIETLLAEDDSPPKRLLFQQDLSSIHTSHKTTHWLQEHNIRVMQDWPPKGPDMNPVENVWAELVRRIELKRRETGVRNKDQLWEDVLQVFNNLPDSYFATLIQSMVRRVGTVYRKRGGWTKY
ncbi:hypothetical protein JTE90_022630 [Oedothorax gibbosus]|uniref:Transposase n=1 Tax=Oedothorax gibbosus TaxID=931172 RepID=A0AAV6TTE6_9ARAC|nr:hypothetical protein JTE90_022630 [Oedothorax gibbosus]